MKKSIILAAAFLIISTVPLFAQEPPGIEEAFRKADGVVIGLNDNFGSGAFPFMELWVLDTIKGDYPGEKISVYFPGGSLPPGGIMEVLKKHGGRYIIPYSGPRDENGRYRYLGPVFDSPDIIANDANIQKFKPAGLDTELPDLAKAVKSSEIVAFARYHSYDPNTVLNRFYFDIEELEKGEVDENTIPVYLDGKYIAWFTGGGPPGMQRNLDPLLTSDIMTLCLDEKNGKYYYSGPEFSEAMTGRRGGGVTFDATWWLVAAIAMLIAIIAALLISKVDYKYDRRMERLEKLRSGMSDSVTDNPDEQS